MDVACDRSAGGGGMPQQSHNGGDSGGGGGGRVYCVTADGALCMFSR
jgi:hypothetical protein